MKRMRLVTPPSVSNKKRTRLTISTDEEDCEDNSYCVGSSHFTDFDELIDDYEDDIDAIRPMTSKEQLAPDDYFQLSTPRKSPFKPSYKSPCKSPSKSTSSVDVHQS